MRVCGRFQHSISRKKIYTDDLCNNVQIREVYLHIDAYRQAMERLYKMIWQVPKRRWVLTYVLGATGRRIGEALLPHH